MSVSWKRLAYNPSGNWVCHMSETEGHDLENPFPEPVEIEITDSIDLHAFRPKDVKAVVEADKHGRHKGAFDDGFGNAPI